MHYEALHMTYTGENKIYWPQIKDLILVKLATIELNSNDGIN